MPPNAPNVWSQRLPSLDLSAQAVRSERVCQIWDWSGAVSTSPLKLTPKYNYDITNTGQGSRNEGPRITYLTNDNKNQTSYVSPLLY
jgi:hypothetical protein